MLNAFTFTAVDTVSKVLAYPSPVELQVLHQDTRNQRADILGDRLREAGGSENW